MSAKRMLFLLVFLGSVVLAGCGPEATPEPDVISLRLKWNHQTQFAGIYVADQEGYYAEENLIVEIEPVDLDSQVTLEEVLSGNNDIAIGAAEEVIIARNEGKPIQAIAVIFRLNPLIYMAPASAGINSPADLVGKTVALSPGQGTYLYEAMMGRAGIDRNSINEIEATAWGYAECWETADICATYATNNLALATFEGVEATALWPSDYGVVFYADVILATDDFIEENPDLVRRFVRATLRGWQRAIEDPELATAATMVVDPSLDEDFQLVAMTMSIPLIDTGEGQLGLMRPEVWQNMHDVLLEHNIISAPVDLAEVYTNEFIEEE